MKNTIFTIYFIFIFSLPMAHAFTIDGLLEDWGIQLGVDSQNKFYLDYNTPSGGNDIDYITEDNADKNSGSINVGPGYTTGNTYDAEAIYFDNDNVNAYIAVVTGLSQSEVKYPAGDIFIDTGKYQNTASPDYDSQKYAFAIDVDDSKLYAVSSWENVIYTQHSESNPWEIGDEKVYLGDIDFVYSSAQNTHYVLEAQIPLSLLNIDPRQAQGTWVHWTMKCGNDSLTLQGDISPVPEPASIILLGFGLSGLFGLKKKRLA